MGIYFPKIEFAPLVYGYANARAHAMFSKLITSQQIAELIRMPSVDTIIETLNRTEYRQEILDLSLSYKGEQLIDFALSNNFAKFCNKIYQFTPKKDKKIIFALLSKWDSHNLKLIISAKRHNYTWNQIRPHIVLAGSLQLKELEELFTSQNSEEFYSKLKITEFGKGFLSSKVPFITQPLKQAFKVMDSDLFIFDMMLLSLDFYQFIILQQVIEQAKKEKQLSAFLSSFADEKNLQIVLRLAKEDLDLNQIRQYLLPSGNIPISRWLKAIAKKDTFAILSSFLGLLPVGLAIEEYKKSKNLSDIEKLISVEFAKKRLKVFRGANLSLAVLVAALFFKEQEVDNIRKILRAKQYGFAESEVEQLIVL
ncbi:MAG: V-type ATPase subunit [Candidatus Anstonellaceae archaeon]